MNQSMFESVQENNMKSLITQNNFLKTSFYGLVAALMLSASVNLDKTTANAQQDQSPADLYSTKCSACHNLPDPKTNAMTVVGWQRTVDRMMNQHGASDSITPDQEKIILAYLDTFAVKPDRQGGQANRENLTDVWTNPPTYSHAYSLSSDSVVAELQTLSGRRAFRATVPGGEKELILAATGGTDALLSVHLPSTPQGTVSSRDIQIEADFRTAPPAPGDKSTTPVSLGLAFDITSPGNYRIAAYNDATKKITIFDVNNAFVKIDQEIPITSPLPTLPGNWNHMKLIAVGSELKVWLDYTKYVTTVSPTEGNPGDVGVWTDTRAETKNLIVDVYPPIAASNVNAVQ
jgi:hypothetical protein